MPFVIVVLTLFTALMAADADAETEAERLAVTQQKTEPKEITIYIREGHKAVAATLLDAVDEGTPITGIADFDSLSATYGLMGVYRKGSRSSGFYGHRFRLTFPLDADVAAIAGAYWNLPYVQSVEPKPSGWGFDDFDDIENSGLRLLAKVATGTASGVVFTAMSVFVVDVTEERKGDPDADAYRPIGFLLAGGAIGCSVGFPWGVSKVDPYDSLPKTLLAGVIPGLAGYRLLGVSQQHAGTAFLLMYVVPVVNSLIASELWREPPQDRRVSFGLAPTLNGGLSASAILHF